jgi:hypothetical protein
MTVIQVLEIVEVDHHQNVAVMSAGDCPIQISAIRYASKCVARGVAPQGLRTQREGDCSLRVGYEDWKISLEQHSRYAVVRGGRELGRPSGQRQIGRQ